MKKGDVEWAIKLRAGIGNDVEMFALGNWKILKSEMVFEHQNVCLKIANCRCETGECNLVDIDVNMFISKINIQTKTKYFTGRNKKGFPNHIEKIVMQNAIFNLYVDYIIENFWSMWFNGKFQYITAIYQNGDVESAGTNMVNV
jgi:5-formaminoimidazole-4-carboxamide-1-beta-D-ribofuranosyl 5'-monophosphate synthetase